MNEIILALMIIIFSQASDANNVSDTINKLLSTKSKNTPHKLFENTQLATKSDFNQINQKYALVFFYRASCPHCQRMAPVVKAFSKDYGFHVYAYSTQGQTLPSFPNAMPMNEKIVTTFFSTPNFVVPSLFLINTETLKAILIDQGEEPLTDLYAQVQQFKKMLKSNGAGNEI